MIEDPILDAAEDVVHEWAQRFPAARFTEDALLKVRPREVVDLVAGVMRGKAEENFVPGDRVEHLTGRVGTVREFTDANGIVIVHWDGNGPDHVSSVPRAHLSRKL